MGTREYLVSVDCPAKINLTLFVLGRRDDGFHDLQSIVAQTAFGDSLKLEWKLAGGGDEDRVIVDRAIISEGENTVLAAIRHWRLATGFDTGIFTVRLSKKIPIGAGLGGGSSDGAAVLRAIRELKLMEEAAEPDWLALAAKVGSDCPLFMTSTASLVAGRGESISHLEAKLAQRLSGREILLFKPCFSISTAEAYYRLARTGLYTEEEVARALFQRWAHSEGESAGLPEPGNDFERLLEGWIPSIPLVLRRLRERHGIDARLTGSGSACFAFPRKGSSDIKTIESELRRAWGETYWMEESILQ